MRRSLVEGVAYAIMFGLADLYFVADGVRMGATSVEVGLLVGLPLAAGAIGAWIGLWLLRWAGRRRPVVVTGASCQAAVLLLTAWMQWTAQGTLPRFIALVCAYHLSGQLHGASWSSWMGDLVPARIRGRYFSRRTWAVQIVSFGVLLVGGAVLQGLESPTRGGQGFALLYLLGGLARSVSATLIALTPEGRPAAAPVATNLSMVPHWRRAGDRLLLVGGFVYFAVYIGSPFFTPYMLEDLGFSYVEFTAVSAVLVLVKVVSMPRWGKALDRYGAAATYRLTLVLLAIVPLPWLFVEGTVGVAFAQGLSGFSWAAHEVAFFALVLELNDPSERPRAYTLQTMVNGVAQLVGSLGGGVLLAWLVDPRLVFASTTVARALAVVVGALLLHRIFATVRVGRRALLLRVIGLQPSGGAIHRPMLVQPDEPPAPLDAAPRRDSEG